MAICSSCDDTNPNPTSLTFTPSVEKRSEASLPGELYGLEPLGDRTVVDVKVGEEMVKVKARPAVSGTPGERLSVAVDLDRAHLFDAETGLALSAPGR